MKSLNGADLAGYIKERQAKQVRALRQAHRVQPRLAIVICKQDPVIDTYVRLKRHYGADIAVEVGVHRVLQADAPAVIAALNNDRRVHGVIVQLPLEDPTRTDQIVRLVDAAKDVDALGERPAFDPATPMAINWLLSGYGIDLKGKRIVLIGQGKLVGAPLLKQYRASGHDVAVADRGTTDLKALTLGADIIITAAGSPALLFSDMVKPGAVVVDAGVASEKGRTVGDMAPELYERDDLTITPVRGGVGPLTVCALFENVIRAAQAASAA